MVLATPSGGGSFVMPIPLGPDEKDGRSGQGRRLPDYL
jgi:hypothetical protein